MLNISVGDVVMYKDRKAVVRRTHALGKDSRCELVFEDTGKHQLVDCKDMMTYACKEDGTEMCMTADECEHGAHM